MSNDLKSLYLTAPSGNAGSSFWYKYNIQAKTWTAEPAPAAHDAQLVTDPATGAIWYFGGATNSGDTNEIDKFMNNAWSANVPTVKKDAASGSGTSAIMGSYSGGTSHLVDNKIYIFGGFASISSSPRTYQTFQTLPWLDISTSPPTIGTQYTLGAVPPSRQDHCSVLTSSKKVIIYGGYDSNSRTTYNDVWSLDLVTLIWQQIVTVNLSRPRSGHTCNIVGANIVIFGGRNGTAIGYTDVQVYDVMQSNWMGSYSPKQDTTPVSEPLPGGVNGPGGNHSALSTAALIGIIVGSIALLACVAGVFVYRRRQRKIEIREAEMEKEAYLASLGTDGDDKAGGGKGKRRNNPYGKQSSPFSASTRHLNQRGVSMDVMDTPATTHYDPIGLDSAMHSPSGGGNVQYLMQQLPDGTIAVQPVYLDHQTMSPYAGTPQLQQSPNIMYSENSSLGGVVNSPSPTLQSGPVGGGGASTSGKGSNGYFAPPPPAINSTNPAGISPYGGQAGMSSPALPISSSGGSIPLPPTTPKAGYVLPPSSSVPYPRPIHDASGVPSPMLPQAPLPPNYKPSGAGATSTGSHY
ncbi:Negative regulator of mitotic exit [Linnemannia gamsii]|uniref:Negative regulator of mitotic exit n=1 Tax=Linnemannia gamsii TaxID=64522 RepID=A0ABQ7K928_9FUNG|nr:Negative regulator of mitotic exit [Linnemannia gamsii]